MQNRSLTIVGIFTTVALPLIVSFGFTEACANEIWTVIAPLPGAAIAYIGRKRHGDIDAFGKKLR